MRGVWLGIGLMMLFVVLMTMVNMMGTGKNEELVLLSWFGFGTCMWGAGEAAPKKEGDKDET